MPIDPYTTRAQTTRKREILKYTCSVIILSLAVIGAIAISLLAEKPATRESNALIVQVKVDPVAAYSGTLDIVVPGTVRSHREIRIASEVNGKIEKKYPEFQAGGFVLAGTKLVEIDSQDYKADLNVLQADLEQADKRIQENQRQIEGEQRNVDLAQQNFEIQQRDFKRVQRLASALSRSEVDQARQALNNARTNLTGRKNAVGLLQASKIRLESARAVAMNQLKRSELNLGRVTIYAPVDGVIVEEMVQESDYVRVGSDVAMFEDVSIAEVRCNLTTTELNWIRKNAPLARNGDDETTNNQRDVRARAYQIPKTKVAIYEANSPDVQWSGTLERFDGIGRDEMTKTIPCRIIVPNPIADAEYGPQALVRNMYVKCRIEVQTSSGDGNSSLLFFDELALQPGNFIWKVVDGKLRKERVAIVDRTEKWVDGKRKGLIVARPVGEGLKSGDQVVISPLSQPVEGAPVIVEGAATPSNENDDVDEVFTSDVPKPDTPVTSASVGVGGVPAKPVARREGDLQTRDTRTSDGPTAGR